MLNHFQLSAAPLDRTVENILRWQVTDEADPLCGAVADVGRGYTEPTAGMYHAASLITAYYHPLSAHRGEAELLRRALLGVRFTLRRQHADGTLDLMETNFHDPTYVAFCIHQIGPAYKLLLRESRGTAEETALAQAVTEFMRRGGDAMVEGGFHTPNHRWVLSGALSYCYTTLGDERYRAHIGRFLNEGIDCDENGEFTERSAGIYNITCDRALIMIAEELGMPELYAHVERNLRMVTTYMEPDFTVNTMNSTRQDFGRGASAAAYYEPYLVMARRTHDPVFARLADEMAQAGASCSPVRMLLDPSWQTGWEEIPTGAPETEYRRFYEESGVVRERIGAAALTLVRARPNFARLQVRGRSIGFRFAGSFFGEKGQFAPQSLTRDGDGWVMRYTARADYRRPLAEAPASPLWKDMDHAKRARVGEQTYDVSIRFALTDGALTVRADACTADGACANVPCKLELMMEPGGVYESASTLTRAKPGQYEFQKAGAASVTYNEHTRFRIVGGFAAHTYAESMRGSIFADAKAFTVCMTDFTPFSHEIRIEYE